VAAKKSRRTKLLREAKAVTHGDLRRRSGHTLKRHAWGSDARYSTFKRIERTQAKNLTARELTRFVEALGIRLRLYAYDGRSRFRVRVW